MSVQAIFVGKRRVFCHDFGKECDFQPVSGSIIEQCPECGGLRHGTFKSVRTIVKTTPALNTGITSDRNGGSATG